MTQDEVTIRVPDKGELLKVRIMRRQVMKGEQTPPSDLGVSGNDLTDGVIHMCAFGDDSNVVSCVRVRPIPEDPEVYEITRMATRPEYRRQGIGARVLAAAEKLAIERGAKGFVLDARRDSQNFYARAGYWRTGRLKLVSDDVNYIMVKQIKNAD